MTEYDYYDQKPEVEPPLPDSLLDRLDELKRRQEARGLTNLERAVLLSDLREFNEAMKPLAQTMADMLGEVASNITEAMTPLVEAMGETSRETVGECEECGITIYLGEWHEKRGEDELERFCLPCTRRIVPEELADNQREDYENQEERYERRY